MDEKNLKIVYHESSKSSWNLTGGMVRAAERLGYATDKGRIALFTGGMEKMKVEEIKEKMSEFNVAFANESYGYPRFDKRYEYEKKLPLFDLIITIDQENVERFKKITDKPVYFLPNFVDEEMFRPLDNIEPEVDYCFLGTIYNFRRELHKRLALDIPIHHWTIFADDKKSSTELLVKTINKVKVHFNYPAYFRGTVGRVSEVLACGKFLMQPVLSEGNMVFEDRKHLVIYNSPEEAIELARYYLEHEEERKAIAEAGRQEVLAKHTCVIRLKQVLDLISRHACRQLC